MTAQHDAYEAPDPRVFPGYGISHSQGVPSRQSRVLKRISRLVIRPTLNVVVSIFGMLIVVGPAGTAKARWVQALVAACDYLLYPLRSVRGSRTEVLRLPGCGSRIEKVCGPGGIDPSAAVLYFHGGGLVAGGFNSHRRLVSRLSSEALSPVYSVEYRLVIRHEFVDAVQDGVDAYRAILATGVEPGRVVLGGDSGGAAVALAVAIALRDTGLPMPAGAIALSPWVDFDPTAKLADPRAKADPAIPIAGGWPIAGGTLMAEHVLARSIAGAVALSPVRGELAGLPPFLIHSADSEVLAVDAIDLHEGLLAAGVRSELKLWDGQIHVFQAAADVVPEGRQSLTELGAFVRAVTTV